MNKSIILIIITALLILSGCSTQNENQNNNQDINETKNYSQNKTTSQSEPMPKTTPTQNQTNNTPQLEPEPNPEPHEIPKTTSNINELSNQCESLCNEDKNAYCKEKRTLTFKDATSTIGTCRSFSKYNTEFKRCKGYCESFGEEKGCNLKNGNKDENCDGK